MKNKRIAGTALTAVIAAMIAVFTYAQWFQPEQDVVTVPSRQDVQYASLPSADQQGAVDFTFAAEKAVNSVVHVKTQAIREETYSGNPFYEYFFGEKGLSQRQPVRGFGSGVIVSEDGYIITNNHVIDKMDEIEVVLNDKRTFSAEVIGTDPNTDLALLKIDMEDLPFLEYGNSDRLKLGEWVLAVGNPYNLTSTVTAGIISAKARNINILREQFAIESFIQTDAAVNPGNSGGALVNLNGELMGINTAIASRTGAYSGNSFAVPVSIVKKVINDLKEYGIVQRAFLGVTIQDVTQELADENNIDELSGVYVNGLSEGGAAKDAGIKAGDIILRVNNVPVNSVSQLQEQISKFRPNDEVEVLVKRNGKEKLFEVTLRNMSGDTDIVTVDESLSLLGASFEPVSEDEKEKLGITHGVQVVSLKAGKLLKAGVREGLIITKINNQDIHSVSDIKQIVENVAGGVYIEGIYPDGLIAYYAFGM